MFINYSNMKVKILIKSVKINRVLPEPVFAAPSTSLPFNMWGMALA